MECVCLVSGFCGVKCVHRASVLSVCGECSLTVCGVCIEDRV